MRIYTKITFRENKRRLALLHEFRGLVISYFNNSDNEAAQARTQINRMLDEAHDVILLSGVNPVLTVTPPPVIGGYVRNIDIIVNMFNLDHYRIPPNIVLDHIDRAIGVYESNEGRSFFRTINPFFWVGLVLDYIVEIPFSLLGRAGFNGKKIENSPIGRVVKAILYLIGVLASLLTVLQLTGYLDKFNSVFKKGFIKYGC